MIIDESEIIEERESSTEKQRNIKGLGSYGKHGRSSGYPAKWNEGGYDVVRVHASRPA